jgi:hypothetical protein
MKVFCCNRGHVGTSAEHTNHLRHGSVEMVLVIYHARMGEGWINNYLLFAYEDSEVALTLKKLGWESDREKWNGEYFTRFTDLDKSKEAIRYKLEDIFPHIDFEQWENIF